jgi:hypothetical protein
MINGLLSIWRLGSMHRLYTTPSLCRSLQFLSLASSGDVSSEACVQIKSCLECRHIFTLLYTMQRVLNIYLKPRRIYDDV